MPTIRAGIRTILVMTIALTGIASFIGAGECIGVAIYRGDYNKSKCFDNCRQSTAPIKLLLLMLSFLLGERVTRTSPHMKRYTDYICVDYDAIIAMGIGGWAMHYRHVRTDVNHIAPKPYDGTSLFWGIS